ncbi:hypothetical protein GUITHDRAFT_151542 [Guillardia theta CCMP2712]|uniref:DUF1664 domain-containing protein n=1 Tax=Guillardia theta (strain CCMP2712) TaxID=905079 RepID=L1JME1_GUITC|nr:hypothetical protein GUITHDRAFT_151542 [Guillardia theta CCMP2712]EKX49414.1 hypothetical protein GUITHDRAFT_151542 [Guillardia theta CCMP2712]|eukprot:XP_005836394.1 hypothetical protein GUITHDRAFT_151542 [Guillardia theta CCMP2712]
MSQAVGRVVLLLTGGAAGSALWQNKDSLDDVPKQLLQAILGMRTNGGSDGSGLDRKVDNLAQEMRMMMSRSNQGTVIVQSGSSWSFSRIIYLILPGAGVYYYMKWKGYSLADLQWVSSTRFSQAVEAMKTAQEALSIKLNDFRTTAHQALEQFQEVVEKRFLGIQHQIHDQVGEVQGEVIGVRDNLRTVDQRVQLDETQSQLQYTSKGIHLLCSVVSESLGDGSNTARELRQFAQRSPRQIESQQYPQLQDAPVLVDIAPALESSSTTTMKPPPALVGGILGSTWTVRPMHRSTVSTPASEADNPPEPVQ